MKIFRHPKKHKNYIVTVAIGEIHFKEFSEYVLDSWKLYCQIHDLGLIVFLDELIDKKDPYWKKFNWHKLLIGEELEKVIPKQSNICYLDTDILINPNSPNIFDFHDINKISIVSQEKNLPFDLNETRKNVSFFRHFYYSKSYPLNSSIFLTPKEMFEFHNKSFIKDNYTCSGLFVFNLGNFGEFFRKIFFKYSSETKTLSGGEQFYFNYELFKLDKINWIEYRFQALWVFEMAARYQYLYYSKPISKKEIKEAIQSSLLSNYFLHFAGSWYESEMYHDKSIIDNKFLKICKELSNYKNQEINYKSHGIIKPN